MLFFFNDTATTEIYTLSLHDALPICLRSRETDSRSRSPARFTSFPSPSTSSTRSEEHTSELQSHVNLVCRLLLEKKKRFHHGGSGFGRSAQATIRSEMHPAPSQTPTH